MHIDINVEKLVRFVGLADFATVHVSTVHRWRKPGIRGIRLEAVRVGGTWYTTHEAFARFCERLTAAETGEPDAASSVERHTSHRQADSALESDNW